MDGLAKFRLIGPLFFGALSFAAIMAAVAMLGAQSVWGEKIATPAAKVRPAAAADSPLDLTVYDDVVEKLLARMTLAEKVGQMTQAELTSLGDLSAIADLSLGSVLCGGGSDPQAGNSVRAWADAYDACQRQSQASRLKIPLLFGVDAMHGHSNVLGAVIFPHNIGLGCSRDEDLVERIGRATALEIRATGVNWAFAPCVTVPRDDRWGRTYEGYSETPDVVGPLGAALIRGLQGARLDDPTAVLACAKHFVADGGTAPTAPPAGEDFIRTIALDQGDAAIDEAELRNVHLAPYRDAIAAGVGSIMVSYSSWNGLKCTANEYLLTDVLKGELGFQGLVITDYNAIKQLDDDFRAAVRKAVLAGVDMAMEPNNYRQFIDTLVSLVDEGELPVARIDDAVRRILRVKAAMGLLGDDAVTTADRSLIESTFGGPAHRALAREAVQKSLVLLKNEGDLLPLVRSGSILVAGRGADDLGMQCGGWTIDWQGKLGEVTTGGTTILAAVRHAAGSGLTVVHSPDGSLAAGRPKPDVALVVVGEPPYAEGNGDTADLSLAAEDLTAVANARNTGAPVVLVVLSGRPLELGPALASCDAVVAAWLPGTEGAGVVDVLFGDSSPSGQLSFSWPQSSEQHPLNVGVEPYDPLFPVGHGLRYGSSSHAATASPESRAVVEPVGVLLPQ
ncbi:MAG: glycoside hydrolase family 3 C-terminal domain-containing protein [Pirellulales bacterium]|nr:glycoside hydrolase family 3 C-terminal domain-containing protein [Pirellulales bacterium]